MTTLDYIKTISDDELKEIISERIEQLEIESKEINKCDFFGFNISSNFENHHIASKTLSFDMKCMYDGYVPKDTKVTYGVTIDRLGSISNNGMYYRVDDDSYIYDFCQYIKHIDVVNTEDFFEYVLLFLMKYFGIFNLNDRDRDDMFKLIMKDEKTCHEAIREHKLSDFKGKGNALCSEYSIMANNILNVFGIYSCVLFGQLEMTGKGKEGHAFNLVSFKDENTGEMVNALVDFSNGVNVYDFSYNKIGVSPYILYFDSIEDTVNRFVCNGEHLTCKEYDYMVLGNSLLQMFIDKTRDYSPYDDLTVKINSKVKQK